MVYIGKDQCYFDGHEREDVVDYRVKWAQQMMQWQKRMETYPLDNENTDPVQPNLKENEKKMVLVTHDESIFYSNDCKMTRWCEKNETMIIPKGQGRSIMVSSFMCPCHGTMRGIVNGIETISRVIFLPGNSNGDGYWNSDHLTGQLKDVIPLFNELHPNCISIFAFDQSSNHKAMADDALVASRMSSGVTEYKDTNRFRFRDTVYIDSHGEEKIQKMYTVERFNVEAARKEIKRLRDAGQRFDNNDIIDKYMYPVVTFLYILHYFFNISYL